jgi:hypothetical protein
MNASESAWTDFLDSDADELIRQSQTEAKRFNHRLVVVEHLALAIARKYFRERCESLGARLSPGPDMVIIGRLPYSKAFQRFLDFVIGTAPTRAVKAGDLWHGLFSCPVDEIRQSVAFLGLDEQWFKS